MIFEMIRIFYIFFFLGRALTLEMTKADIHLTLRGDLALVKTQIFSSPKTVNYLKILSKMEHLCCSQQQKLEYRSL